MKTRTLVLIGVMIIALAAMAMPVMAGQSAALYGNIQPSASVDTNATNLDMIFTASQGTNTTLGLIVNSNGPYTIGVSGSSGSGSGYMSNYTSSAYETGGLATVLNQPLSVGSTTNSTANADGVGSSPLTSSVTLWTGKSAITNGMLDKITFTQPVTSGTDLRLPAGSNYRIDLTFSITSTG